jgi:hypothetical protein
MHAFPAKQTKTPTNQTKIWLREEYLAFTEEYQKPHTRNHLSLST